MTPQIHMGKGTAAVCRAPPAYTQGSWTAAFMLEKYISVRYNGKYEMNKKGRTERVAALSAPMQERYLLTQHK